MLPQEQLDMMYNGLATRFKLAFDEQEMADIEAKLQQDPQNYYLWCARGIMSLDYDAEKAIDSFSQALTIRPFSAHTLYNRGRALLAQNKYEQAVADFKLATELDKEDGWKWHFLGVALYFLSRFDEAADAFEKAIVGHARVQNDMLPFEVDWLWCLYMKIGNEQAAKDSLKDVYADMPVDPHEITYKRRILVYAGIMSPEEFEGLINMKNDAEVANQMYCLANYHYYITHDMEKAAAYLEKSLGVKTGHGAWGYKMAMFDKPERDAKMAAAK